MSLKHDGEYSALSGPDVEDSTKNTQGGESNAPASAEENPKPRLEGAALQDENDDQDTDDEDPTSTSRRASADLADYSTPLCSISPLAAACTQVKVEVEAAAGRSAQLEGSTEEVQVQALLQEFNSTGVPQVRARRSCACVLSAAM
jgi:hypothetical protein|eukprot:COSAG02_NODE_6_length_64796_cov_76.792865_5_plen_146_part_00